MIGTGLSASALVCTCLAALFDVHAFPLPEPRAHVLLANADADGTADVFVLDGLRLLAYPSAADYAPIIIPLADGTSAFDIVDLDGDGRSEVIAVCHDRILRYAIPAEGTSPPAEELFTLQTQLDPAPSPYPQVLVVKHEGRSLLALPCAGAIELRAADSTLVSRYAAADKTLLVADDDMTAWALWRPPSREGDLNLDVWILRQFEPKSVTAGKMGRFPISGLDRGVARAQGFRARDRTAGNREASQFSNDPERRAPDRFVFDGDPSEEPSTWFPLKTDRTTLLRALCKPARRGQSTTVRIREAKSEEDDFLDKNTTLGPARNYAGEQVSYIEDYPDFNGDGYVDLTLWKAPSPGMSVDALTRAITGGAWPLDLVFHLFSPEKRRFEAAACSRIALTVPVRWFLEGEPVQNEVFRDFDGDKRTDFALSDTDHSFSAWLFTDNGFSRSPDFRRTFPESIQDVAFRADLDGSGRTSIGLRTDKHLYLLKATS